MTQHEKELTVALKAVVDVLVRCDGETRPNDLPECTDEEWDAALEQAQAVLAKAV